MSDADIVKAGLITLQLLGGKKAAGEALAALARMEDELERRRDGRFEDIFATLRETEAEVERLRTALGQIADETGLWEPEGFALAAFARQVLKGAPSEARS